MDLKKTLETPDNIKYELYVKGLNEQTVRSISAEQKEPKRMLDHRLKCLQIFQNLPIPTR
jgi:hypothetical protein